MAQCKIFLKKIYYETQKEEEGRKTQQPERGSEGQMAVCGQYIPEDASILATSRSSGRNSSKQE